MYIGVSVLSLSLLQVPTINWIMEVKITLPLYYQLKGGRSEAKATIQSRSTNAVIAGNLCYTGRLE